MSRRRLFRSLLPTICWTLFVLLPGASPAPGQGTEEQVISANQRYAWKLTNNSMPEFAIFLEEFCDWPIVD